MSDVWNDDVVVVDAQPHEQRAVLLVPDQESVGGADDLPNDGPAPDLRRVPFAQDPWGILARVVEVTAVHRFEDRFSLLRQRPFDVQRCRE